ncbi:MAG: hypothetical protein VYD19_06100 [Myxococcota bacterium]|nr:hypothetical protein [Myxococcota bacterium]
MLFCAALFGGSVSAELPGKAALIDERVRWHHVGATKEPTDLSDLQQQLSARDGAIDRARLVSGISDNLRRVPLSSISVKGALELATLLTEGEQPFEALELIQRAQKQWVNDPTLELGRGQILYRLGQLSAARASFDSLYARGLRSPQLRYLLAMSLWKERPRDPSTLTRAKALIDGLMGESPMLRDTLGLSVDYLRELSAELGARLQGR